MVISLDGLECKIENGKRFVCVTVATDGENTDAELQFQICENNITKKVTLLPALSAEVCVEYNGNGPCPVSVEESGSGKSAGPIMCNFS